MIRMKVKESTTFDLKEANLPVPMPRTLEEARRELGVCESRGDWTRAAALRYSAIPYLEQMNEPVREVPRPAEAVKPAPQRARTYTPPPMTAEEKREAAKLIGLAFGSLLILMVWCFLGAAVGNLAPSHCFIAGFVAVPILLCMGPVGWLVVLGGVLKFLHG